MTLGPDSLYQAVPLSLLSPVHCSPQGLMTHPLSFHIHIANSSWHAISREVTYQYKNELVPEECEDFKPFFFFSFQMPFCFAAGRSMDQFVEHQGEQNTSRTWPPTLGFIICSARFMTQKQTIPLMGERKYAKTVIKS